MIFGCGGTRLVNKFMRYISHLPFPDGRPPIAIVNTLDALELAYVSHEPTVSEGFTCRKMPDFPTPEVGFSHAALTALRHTE